MLSTFMPAGERDTTGGLIPANQELKMHLQFSFPPLPDFCCSGEHKSQSSVSVGSLPFIWKQSLSWPGRSSCFRTDPDVQMCCSPPEVSLIGVQK